VLYYLRASMNEALGRSDGAVGDYARAITLAPGFGLAYSGRARLRLNGIMESAGLPLVRGREMPASAATVPSRLLDEIMGDAEQAVSLDPDASWGYGVRAEVYLRRAHERAYAGVVSSDLQRAINDASNALAAEPNLSRARLVRAIAYYASNRPAEAQSDLVLVLQNGSDSTSQRLAREFYELTLAQ
jgi:tetratricopeptide (TPR) repeat protein